MNLISSNYLVDNWCLITDQSLQINLATPLLQGHYQGKPLVSLPSTCLITDWSFQIQQSMDNHMTAQHLMVKQLISTCLIIDQSFQIQIGTTTSLHISINCVMNSSTYTMNVFNKYSFDTWSIISNNPPEGHRYPVKPLIFNSFSKYWFDNWSIILNTE